jgi:TM2 domain-containing membrane protein YozV
MSFSTFLDVNPLIKHLNEQQKVLFFVQYNQQSVNQNSANIFALFNFDRIYFGQIFVGLLKLIASIIFIWWLIDLFTIKNRTIEYNKSVALQIIASMNLGRGD